MIRQMNRQNRREDPTVKRRRSLKPEDTLLIGRLVLPLDQWRWRGGHCTDRPVLSVSVWCPRCKQSNLHGFPDRADPGLALDVVTHRVGHCDCLDYWIGLDPDAQAKADHLVKLGQFAELVEVWTAARVDRQPALV